jgi:hypothetical protein
METLSIGQVTSLACVSDDVLLLVGEACSDPLAPKALVHLVTTSNQLCTTLQPKLQELLDFRAKLRLLCSQERSGCTLPSMAEATSLD